MVEKLKKFVELLKKYNLEELEVEDGDFKISLKKATNIKNNTIKKMNKTSGEEKKEEEKIDNINIKEKEYKILSPIVGIFRNKSQPNASLLSEEKKLVHKDQIVAMIEIFSEVVEVRSEVEGIIKEVLVVDGEAVEYNQPLMIIQQKP